MKPFVLALAAFAFLCFPLHAQTITPAELQQLDALVTAASNDVAADDAAQAALQNAQAALAAAQGNVATAGGAAGTADATVATDVANLKAFIDNLASSPAATMKLLGRVPNGMLGLLFTQEVSRLKAENVVLKAHLTAMEGQINSLKSPPQQQPAEVTRPAANTAQGVPNASGTTLYFSVPPANYTCPTCNGGYCPACHAGRR